MKKTTTTIMAICRSSITGIPIKKAGFIVLCLNTFIPRRHPIEPPSNAKVKSVASGMRHLALFDLLLSIPNAINPPRVTRRIYSKMTLITFIFFIITSC